MKLIIQKFFIVLVILILSLPLCLKVIGVKVEPSDKTQKKISLNFKRNFPLKEDLLKVYRDIKLEVLHTNPLPHKVINVSDGWKFLGDNFSNVLSESKGIINFSKKEIDTLKKKLVNRMEWCQTNNIKFYLAVPPNKHSVYGELIPIAKSNKSTKMQQLDSLASAIGLNFINLGSKFSKHKSTHQLYFKTDTHWNDYGGFYGFKSTIEAIKKDFKDTNFKDFTLSDMEETIGNKDIGDLNKMLMLKKDEPYTFLKFKTPETAIQLEKKLEVRKGYHNDPSIFENRTKSETNDLKILIFHDSYMGFYSKYLKENFGSSVFIWDFVLDKELILNEKPDILYHEILERDLDLLLKN